MSESPSPRLQFRRLLPLLVMLLFVLGFPVPVRAQGTAAARLADFDTFVARALAEYRVPGAAVAVVEDGKVTFIKGYGLRDVTKPGKVDQNAIFQLASISTWTRGASRSGSVLTTRHDS